MRQHRAFCHAGGATGILQERQVRVDDIGFDILQPPAALQRTAERNSRRQMVFRHQPLNVFHHKVNQRTFGSGELVAHARQDHVLYLGVEHHFFQRVGEVGDDHDGAGTAVVQLVLQFTRRIQWVNVDHHHAGSQNAKQCDRILQQIRHHQGNAVTLLQTQFILQVSGKSATTLFQLAVGHHLAHVHKSGLIRVTLNRIFKHFDQR
ncbi:hypothetical protein D3C78_1197320 [compost metagenome]